MCDCVRTSSQELERTQACLHSLHKGCSASILHQSAAQASSTSDVSAAVHTVSTNLPDVSAAVHIMSADLPGVSIAVHIMSPSLPDISAAVHIMSTDLPDISAHHEH